MADSLVAPSFADDVLVVVPARGGSKRIPRKNIVDVCGQPMICWPLMELAKIVHPDQLIVSTDDAEIKELVEDKGLSVPFLRPKSLSDDFTATLPVIHHALNWYENHVRKVTYVLVVYPTAVMIDCADVLRSYQTLRENELCDVVFSATSFAFPIQRAIFEDESGYVSMFHPEFHSARSQDLQEAMHDAGQFYFFRSGSIKLGRELPNAKARICKLDRSRVADIDTIEDLEVAKSQLIRANKDKPFLQWSF